MEIVDQAIDAIGQWEKQNAFRATQLRACCEKPLPVGSDWAENRLLQAVEDHAFNGKAAGVDSGFVDKPLFGFSLLIVRAVGVVFEIENNCMRRAHYFPSPHPFPLSRISSKPLDALALTENNGLLRLVEELEMAKTVIAQHRPDYCFLDGSLLPQYALSSSAGGPNFALFRRVIEKLESLFSLAEASNVQLLGCVEDARATRFCELVQSLAEHTAPPKNNTDLSDAILLDHWLKHNERTAVFRYTANPSAHPLLSKLSTRWQNQIQVFYCRPAELDRPLRIEFLSPPEQASVRVQKIASVVQALSGSHREYAYPSVLIEADLCARLRPEEIDLVYNKIIDKLGKRFTRGLRRNARPF